MSRPPDGTPTRPASDDTPGASQAATGLAPSSLVEAVAQLADQNARFLAILDAHPERISVVDPATHEVLYVNRVYRAQLARDPTGRICYAEFHGRTEPCDFCRGHLLAEQPGKPLYWEFHDERTGRDYEVTDLLTPWTDGRPVHYQQSIDITARRRSTRHLATAIDTTIDGYWVCDTQGRILEVNGALCRMLGYERDEMLAMNVSDISGIDSPVEISGRIARMMVEGTARFESRHRRRDGSLVDVAVRCTYMDFEGGRIFVFTTDITERVELQRRLQENVAELARSNTELEQFAYMASHDMQEPLRKIQSFGDRLRSSLGDQLDDRSRDYMARMLDSAERMQRLINDLLTYSRVGASAHAYGPVDLAEVARQAVSDLEVRIEHTQGSIVVEPLPAIEADATQMRMLLQNLLANALKFHQPGVAPRVVVGGGAHNGNVTMTVADNGIGFDEKYKDRIFRIFQRLHARHEYEGTGLGLAVCEKIVQRHHGSIDVTSEPGRGTTFTITLPRNQPSRGGQEHG